MSTFLLNQPGKMTATTVQLDSSAGLEAYVFDDFFADPAAVRQAALDPQLSWASPDNAYPGLRTSPTGDFTDLAAFLSGQLERPIAAEQLDSSYSMITIDPRDLSDVQSRPHWDGPCFAGLVYLNPPEQCTGGTAFYRHRATGLLRYPDRMTPAHLAIIKNLGLKSPRELQKALEAPPAAKGGFMCESDEEWEKVEAVEMRFNRLVMYDGQIFHSGLVQGDDFGVSPEERRLTFNFFLYVQFLSVSRITFA